MNLIAWLNFKALTTVIHLFQVQTRAAIKPIRHLSFRDRSDLNARLPRPRLHGRIDISCAHAQLVRSLAIKGL